MEFPGFQAWAWAWFRSHQESPQTWGLREGNLRFCQWSCFGLAFDLILDFKCEPGYLVSQRQLVEDLQKFHVVFDPSRALNTQRKLPDNSRNLHFLLSKKSWRFHGFWTTKRRAIDSPFEDPPDFRCFGGGVAAFHTGEQRGTSKLDVSLGAPRWNWSRLKRSNDMIQHVLANAFGYGSRNIKSKPCFRIDDMVAACRCLSTRFLSVFCNPVESFSHVILVTSWDGMLTFVKLLFGVQPLSKSVCFCTLNRQAKVCVSSSACSKSISGKSFSKFVWISNK